MTARHAPGGRETGLLGQLLGPSSVPTAGLRHQRTAAPRNRRRNLLGNGSDPEVQSSRVIPLAVSVGADEVPSFAALRVARQAVLEVAARARHGASNVRVFGSVARGTATELSDIDFLVDLELGRTLFDLAALWRDLEGLSEYA